VRSHHQNPTTPPPAIFREGFYDAHLTYNDTIRHGFLDPTLGLLWQGKTRCPRLSSCRHDGLFTYAVEARYGHTYENFEELALIDPNAPVEEIPAPEPAPEPAPAPEPTSDPTPEPITEPEVEPQPAFVLMHYNSAGWHNSKLKYGNTLSDWNDYGAKNLDDTVPIEVVDYLNLRARDANLAFEENASSIVTPDDSEVRKIDGRLEHFDYGFGVDRRYSGTINHEVTPVWFYAGDLQHNKHRTYGEVAANYYYEISARDEFAVQIFVRPVFTDTVSAPPTDYPEERFFVRELANDDGYASWDDTGDTSWEDTEDHEYSLNYRRTEVFL
jgi:hypothetical protein